MRFMQTESVLQTKNRSGPAKNRFSVALPRTQPSFMRTVKTEQAGRVHRSFCWFCHATAQLKI